MPQRTANRVAADPHVEQGHRDDRSRPIHPRQRHARVLLRPAQPVATAYQREPNGLLREYFPKGEDLGHVTPAELARVELELKNRQRRTLHWLSPIQRLAELCALIP